MSKRVVTVAIWLAAMSGLLWIVYQLARSQNPLADDLDRCPPRVDWECRLEPLADGRDESPLDLSAFVGMPDAYRELASEYVLAVNDAIDAPLLKRKRYYHRDRSGQRRPDRAGAYFDRFPDDANPVFDRDVVVPILLLPRPEAIERKCLSPTACVDGWRPPDGAFDRLGWVYGRTVIFEPGRLSESPRYALPAAPLKTTLPTPGSYFPFDHHFPFFLKSQKIVTQPFSGFGGSRILDVTEELHLGEEDGALLLAELSTVPVHSENSRLRWVKSWSGPEPREFLAYALVDGNGAKRADEYLDLGNGRLSPYLRPLNCEVHQPRVIQHDLLLLPTPLAWGPAHRHEELSDQSAHEEWCLDYWFAAQPDACWVIRETADSKPLQESFALMPAREESELSVFFVSLFVETDPVQLVKELAALHGVSPQSVLESPRTMERLKSIYSRIRMFPLDQ